MQPPLCTTSSDAIFRATSVPGGTDRPWAPDSSGGARQFVGQDESATTTTAQAKAIDSNVGVERRWVIDNGDADASRVPPGWRAWLCHNGDVSPSEENYQPAPGRGLIARTLSTEVDILRRRRNAKNLRLGIGGTRLRIGETAQHR
ncbi:NADH-ubiquinone oxidoreductase subunit NDUFA12 family protein [Microvirga sp. 2MCAF38]|uniref:NADH-ubiquinone oxidoreductase subunit NDUFA12 family protein n=1 Tax=Microvirga sp. 2MCAF38 TaxID=3232989 RepID=UPI003F94EFF3